MGTLIVPIGKPHSSPGVRAPGHDRDPISIQPVHVFTGCLLACAMEVNVHLYTHWGGPKVSTWLLPQLSSHTPIPACSGPHQACTSAGIYKQSSETCLCTVWPYFHQFRGSQSTYKCLGKVPLAHRYSSRRTPASDPPTLVNRYVVVYIGRYKMQKEP